MGLPGELASLIRDCWAEKPSDRPTFRQISARVNNLSPMLVDDYFVGSRKQWQLGSANSISWTHLPQMHTKDAEILHKASAFTHPLRQQRATLSCDQLVGLLFMGTVTIYSHAGYALTRRRED